MPAPNRACGECEFCRGDYPYYFCRRLENYGNSLTCAEAPHLFGGWAEFLYLRPGTPVFKVPDDLPTNVAVLTELFAVTHSLDLAAKMPRPGGFRAGDTVAVVGIGPVGIVHVAKAALLGRVARDRDRSVRTAVALGRRARCHRHAGRQRRRPGGRAFVRDLTAGRGVDVVVDATGHPASFVPSLSLLRDGGTLIEVGAFVDLGTVPINPATILGRNLTIVGVAGEDARVYDSTLAMLAAHHETVPFHHAVTHTFPLEQVEAGDADCARRRRGDEGRPDAVRRSDRVSGVTSVAPAVQHLVVVRPLEDLGIGDVAVADAAA